MDENRPWDQYTMGFKIPYMTSVSVTNNKIHHTIHTHNNKTTHKGEGVSQDF